MLTLFLLLLYKVYIWCVIFYHMHTVVSYAFGLLYLALEWLCKNNSWAASAITKCWCRHSLCLYNCLVLITEKVWLNVDSKGIQECSKILEAREIYEWCLMIVQIYYFGKRALSMKVWTVAIKEFCLKIMSAPFEWLNALLEKLFDCSIRVYQSCWNKSKAFSPCM